MNAVSGSDNILALRRQFPIALWAAGYADASVLEAFTVDEILDGCSLHKIVGAAHDRVTRALQSGSTPRLAHGRQLEQGLSEEQAAMLRGFEPKRRVLSEVARCVADRGVRILYLKGATRHLHSGRLADFRSGDDLDLLVSDEDECQAALSQLGAHTYRTTSDHEFANVEIDGVKVDFHRYYPAVVPALRSGDAVAVPQADAFALAQRAHRVGELRFDVLDAGSVAFPGMPDHVRFAAPAAAAMISATHAYRDFFVRASLSCRFKPLIRVGDLDEWRYFTYLAGEGSIARHRSRYPDLGASHRWIAATQARLSRVASGMPMSPTDGEVPEAICRSLFGPLLTRLASGATQYASQPTTGEVITLLGATRVRRLAAGSGPCDLRGAGTNGSTVLFGAKDEKHERGEVRLETVNVTRSPDTGYTVTIDTYVAAHDSETRLLLEWDSEAVEIAERAGATDLQIKTSAGWSGKVGVEWVRNGASRRCRVTLPPGGVNPAAPVPVLVGLAGLGAQQQYRQGALASFQIDV